MTGYELRLWRKGLGWSRDRAAEALGVSLRTYKDYENATEIKRSIELATVALSLGDMMPLLRKKDAGKLAVIARLETLLGDAVIGQQKNAPRAER